MAELDEEIRVRINSSDKKKLSELAQSKGLGLSTWVRQLLISEKKKHGKK